MHCNSAGALFARRRSGSKRTMRPAAEMERIRMKKSIVIGALLLIALALPFAALAEGDAAEIKESTCSHNGGFTANGQNGHICILCKEEFGHNISAQVTEPTCQSVGYTMDVCEQCGWQGDQYDIRNADPDAHVWGEWTTTSESSCSVQGTRERACGVCLATESEKLPLAQHDLHAQICEPSCVEDGYTVEKCENCGYIGEKTDIVPRSAAYHKWGEFSVTEEPGCTEPGSQERVCSVCSAKHRQEIEAVGHKTELFTAAPGCEDGYTVERCTVCGEETGERTNIVPGGHKWSKWTTEAEADCEKDGLRQRTCSVCGKTEQEQIPALGHEFKEGVSRPTCVSDGYTAVICTKCGLQDGEKYDIVPAGEEYHVGDEDRWERESEPTCTEWGMYYQGCLYCDTMLEVPIMPKGHEAQEHVFEADFAHDGYKVEICSVCGKEAGQRYDIVPAGMYSVPMQETQVTDLEIAGMESAVLCTAVSEEGETAAVLEIRVDAAGVIEIDFDGEWFRENHVVRAVVHCGVLSIEAEAEGVLRIETAAAQEGEGLIITVLCSLPNDGFGEEAGQYRRGVYRAELSEDEPTMLRGRCMTIGAPKGKGTLLVVSSAQEDK